MAKSVIPELNQHQVEELKKMVSEALNAKLQEESFKDLRKDISNRAKEELNLPTKHFNKLVTNAFNDTFRDIDEESERLLDLAQRMGYYQGD